MKKFDFIDLFAGIGGFHIALRDLGGKCVFASEIDDRACDTYERNHGLRPEGDIRKITSPEKLDQMVELAIPDHDILAAGFPCQPFSLAGVSARNSLGISHGLMDETQGTLFYDIARVAKIKRPKVLFLENVSNIVNHDSGRTFSTIRNIIERELDYSFQYQILNSESLVPQRRKRCFIVAFRDKLKGFEFPDLSGEPLALKSILETEVADEFTLSDKGWAGHQRRTKANLARGTGFTAFEADLEKPSNTIVARYYKDGKECLVPQLGENPRMLTPRECARLQGFPETFVPHPSKSVAYKQFGNAVPVPVVKAVAKNIIETIEVNGGRQSNKTPTLKEHGRNPKQGHEAGKARSKVPSRKGIEILAS